jgi:replication factor C subunit 3/5
MFFIDKYRPTKQEDFIFHQDQIKILRQMSQDASIPHIIFCGPEGSGKKTMVDLFMEMIYDQNVHKMCTSIYKITGSAGAMTDEPIRQSNYHIVIEPHNNNYDKYLIQGVVKEYAKKISLQVFPTNKTFKTVLINNIDNLSYYAQTSLRRTMERYSATCRFVMICRSLSSVIDPIRSRCFSFKVAAPSTLDLFNLMARVSAAERMRLELDDYIQIIRSSEHNVKKVMWMMQLKSLGENSVVSYDVVMSRILDRILSRDSRTIPAIIDMVYNILITNISGSKIIRDITNQILRLDSVSEGSKIRVVGLGCKFEYRFVKGRHDIMHLVPFISGVMAALAS